MWTAGHKFQVHDQGNTLDNNVIHDCSYRGLRVDSTESLEDGYAAAGGYDDFVDPEGWDFYPTGDSHLKDTANPSGDTWVPDTDFNGAPRQGDAPDVGAYEYVGEGNPGWAIREGFKEPGYKATAGEEVGGGCCGDKGESEAGLLWLPVLGIGALKRRRRSFEQR